MDKVTYQSEIYESIISSFKRLLKSIIVVISNARIFCSVRLIILIFLRDKIEIMKLENKCILYQIFIIKNLN